MLDKEVTIIILTYKSAHIIESCLKNIINKNYRIIIVDNGSNDNLQNLLLTKYKGFGIELILLENNVGFSKGNNVALRKVETKYALLLNPDATITAESIDNMAVEMEKKEDIAMANPLFFSTNPRNKNRTNAKN